MKKFIFIVLMIMLSAVTAHAQLLIAGAKRVEYDKIINGYRYIQVSSLNINVPERSVFWTNIAINFYDGYRYPYYVRLYTGCELTEKDEIIFTLADGREVHLYSANCDIIHSRLGLIKMHTIYDGTYLLNWQQLSDIISSEIVGIKIGSEDKWYTRGFKKNELTRWFSTNYNAIRKRLEK